MEDFFRKMFLMILFVPIVIIIFYRLLRLFFYYAFLFIFILTLIIYYILPGKKNLEAVYFFLFHFVQLLQLIRNKEISIIDRENSLDRYRNAALRKTIYKKMVIYTYIKSIDDVLSLFLFLRGSFPLFFCNKNKIKDFFTYQFFSYIQREQKFFTNTHDIIRVVICDRIIEDTMFEQKNNKKTIYGVFSKKGRRKLLFVVKK